MSGSPQLPASAHDPHSEGSPKPDASSPNHVALAASGIVAESEHTSILTSGIFPPSIAPCDATEKVVDTADLDIDDTHISSENAAARGSRLPAASRPPIDNSEPLCTPNPPPSRDTNDPPQNLDINHSAEEQKPAATASPKPTPTSSKKRRSSASASHLFDAAVSKKRTFSLKEHIKDTDNCVSEEETAHSLKWLSMKGPRYFTIEQVERQPPLPVSKFSFVDLMNAAPHLAATVQRNVAISIASDLLLRKVHDSKTLPNPAHRVSGAGSSKSSSSIPKHPVPPALKSGRTDSSPAVNAVGKCNFSDLVPQNAKLDPHIPLKKRKSSTTSKPISGSSLGSQHVTSSAASAMSSSRDRVIPKAPPSSAVNMKLSKQLFRSATHVYIANFINQRKKAEETLKKYQEKHQHQQLRLQQEQRVQQSRFQQQQHMQHQIQNQQQMMQFLQRSQHCQAMQSQDAFLSHSGTGMAQPYCSMASSASSMKSPSQRTKATSHPSLPGVAANYNLSYVMMPPAAGQHAYSSNSAHVGIGYPSSAYSAHAQAQYHNHFLAMQQMSQMNSMNQQHQYVRPPPSTRLPSQAGSGMQFASMGYPASHYMFGPSQSLSSGLGIAASPQAEFHAARHQHALQEHMQNFQPNDQNA